MMNIRDFLFLEGLVIVIDLLCAFTQNENVHIETLVLKVQQKIIDIEIFACCLAVRSL